MLSLLIAMFLIGLGLGLYLGVAAADIEASFKPYAQPRPRRAPRQGPGALAPWATSHAATTPEPTPLLDVFGGT